VDDLVETDKLVISLLERAGVPIHTEGRGRSQRFFVPEWAAIVGRAMLAAIMLTSERDLVETITTVLQNDDLKRSVVGAARIGVKPMDIYLMLRGEEEL